MVLFQLPQLLSLRPFSISISVFTIWVLLGALGVLIAGQQGLKLSVADASLMVAIPILTGSLARLPMGILSDRFGSKRVGIIMLLFLFIPLTLGWLINVNFTALLGIGVMIGLAGAAFAVALPLASRSYPPERQGLVLGIAAAGGEECEQQCQTNVLSGTGIPCVESSHNLTPESLNHSKKELTIV